ncbi:MAG: hypothetical protein NTW12_14930 [Deltaproteobacteria bacterium]|nr:hypothetical protein [Deltaproteobacteria bacterium]
MGDGRKEDYFKRTQDMLKGLIPAIVDGQSWLDHKGEQAWRIDEMILAGKYTIKDIARVIYDIQPSDRIKPLKIMIQRVNKHKDHLTDKFNVNMAPHRFQVKVGPDGIVRFDFTAMKLSIDNQSALQEKNKDIQQHSGYLPNRSDFKKAYKSIVGEMGKKGAIDDVLDQMQRDAEKDGKTMKPNWRMITEANIRIWESDEDDKK